MIVAAAAAVALAVVAAAVSAVASVAATGAVIAVATEAVIAVAIAARLARQRRRTSLAAANSRKVAHGPSAVNVPSAKSAARSPIGTSRHAIGARAMRARADRRA